MELKVDDSFEDAKRRNREQNLERLRQIKAQLNSDECRTRKASGFLVDMMGIFLMEEQGCFDGQIEKRDELITAALVQMLPHSDRWTEGDRREHSEHAPQLPSRELSEIAKETPFLLWLTDNAHKLGAGFHLISLLAFAFLFLAIVTASFLRFRLGRSWSPAMIENLSWQLCSTLRWDTYCTRWLGC